MATPSVPAGYKLVPDDNQAPEARGKAAALSAYLARKGSPQKGKRLDRAVAKFETMWANSPDAIKEKYAGRSQKTDLAPSERGDLAPIPRPTNASLNAARPGESASQVYARQKESRTGKAAAPPAPAKSPADKDPVAVGTPEEQARVAAMINEGSSFATADNGDQSTKAAMAAERARLEADAKANPPTEAQRSTPSSAPPSPNLPPDAPAPAPAKRPGPTMAEAFSANDANPFMNVDPAVDAVRDQAKNQAQTAIDAKRVAGDEARNRINNERAAAEASRLGVTPPAATPPAVQPAPAATKTVAPARPPTAAEGNKSPAFLASNAEYGKIADQRMAPGGPAAPSGVMAPVAQPTGSPVMETPMSKGGQPMDPAIKSDGPGLTRVNRLTGLPFGFRPGDTLPKSGDAAMQQRAGDSQTRQSQAQSSAPARPVAPVAGPRAMPRGPASQPERTGSAIAPIAPPRANDPDIIRKDNVAAANYQSSFSGGNPGDAEFDAAKNGQKKLYDGASSLDQAKLAVNTLKRNAAMDDTRGAPRAKVVAPARRPVLAR